MILPHFRIFSTGKVIFSVKSASVMSARMAASEIVMRLSFAKLTNLTKIHRVQIRFFSLFMIK
jgi:hypothetical protein